MKDHDHRHGRPRKVRVEKPAMEHGEDEGLWAEVRKFARLVPQEPEPNMGRADEIKEDIRRGRYITPEVMEETVARLVIRFMTKE